VLFEQTETTVLSDGKHAFEVHDEANISFRHHHTRGHGCEGIPFACRFDVLFLRPGLR
jgi:hypothetical protein